MAAPIPAVLANGAELLNLLSAGPIDSVAEVAEGLGIPRPSVYRLLDAFRAIGMVDVTERGGFRLGVDLLRLGDAASAEIPEVAAAGPIMRQLHATTGLTTYLCALRGDEVRCLDWIPGVRVGLLLLKPGGSLPAYAGATSRALLAYDDTLRARVGATQGWTKFTPQTLDSPRALDADAEWVRERGYAISNEDVTTGVAALGVPLFDRAGRMRAALSVAGLSEEILGGEGQLSADLMRAATRFTEQFQDAL